LANVCSHLRRTHPLRRTRCGQRARPGYQLGGINRAQDNITVQFRNAEGTIEFRPAALHVEERVALREPIFANAFRSCSRP
jgi:hypothetical protein